MTVWTSAWKESTYKKYQRSPSIHLTATVVGVPLMGLGRGAGVTDLAGVAYSLQVEGTAHLGHGQGHLLQPCCKASCCLLRPLLITVHSIQVTGVKALTRAHIDIKSM